MALPRIVKIVLAVIVAIPVAGLLASVLLASLTGTRISGNEAAAIGSLRSIVSAQASFAAGECQGLYAPTLPSLGASGHLAPDLAVANSVEKSGYRITMSVPPPTGAAPNASAQCEGASPTFTATAIPIEPGTTGRRFFVTDQSGDVKHATSETFADATPLR